MKKLLAFLIVLNAFAVSCTTSKQMVYINDLKEDSVLQQAYTRAVDSFSTRIQKNDLLWITVGGPNSADLIAINSATGITGQMGGAIANQGQQVFGFLVEADGTIKLPYVGTISAEGLSRIELEKQLAVLFADYTKDPVVNVRFLNYRVTVLGEVSRPGAYNIPNERVTILEAIGLAGDLTVMGKRNTVTIIREVNGKREFGTVNLLSKDLFMSPYYYLKTNDVIYVEPTPARFFARERLPQFITLAASSLSLLLTVITITKL